MYYFVIIILMFNDINDFKKYISFIEFREDKFW